MQPEQVDEDVHLRADTILAATLQWLQWNSTCATATPQLTPTTASSKARRTADCSASRNRQLPHYSGSTITQHSAAHGAAYSGTIGPDLMRVDCSCHISEICDVRQIDPCAAPRLYVAVETKLKATILLPNRRCCTVHASLGLLHAMCVSLEGKAFRKGKVAGSAPTASCPCVALWSYFPINLHSAAHARITHGALRSVAAWSALLLHATYNVHTG